MNKLKLRSYDEILQREKLSLEHHVTLTNFDSLISEIDLPKKEEGLTNCQIKKVHNNCNHHFMHGYLVLTSEGKEAILGKDCGNKYFILDERFALQKNQLRAKIERDEAITTLSKLLSNTSQDKIIDTEDRLRKTANDIQTSMNMYSDFIKRKLEKMAKTKNAIVSIDVDYGEINENGEKAPTSVAENVGIVKGTYIWQYQENVGHLIQLLKEIKQTIPNIKINEKQSIGQLKSWITTLSTMPELESGLEKIEREYKNFISPQNILMTTLLTKNQMERERIASQNISITYKKKAEARKALYEFDKTLRNRFKNRNFTIAS